MAAAIGYFEYVRFGTGKATKTIYRLDDVLSRGFN